MKFEIKGYKYECNGIEKAIPDVFIQMDGGDGESIVRKQELISNFNDMYKISREKGYYPCKNIHAISDKLAVTWTNNPYLQTI